jgi:predicted dehydrogenase
VGVHCIDALRYILGAEVLHVSTVARQDALSGEVEAYATMLMEMTGGICGQVVANARTPYRTLLEVMGSDGTLTAEGGFHVDWPVEVVHRAGDQVESSTTVDNGDGYVRMLDGFAAAVRDGAEFLATGEDGVRNMRVVDAAYRSWRSGAREEI